MVHAVKTRFFEIFDVFSDKVLAGNPVAIVYDTEGLTNAQMQAIAGEFNFAQTVFVFPAENPRHSAKLRIFKPSGEMPFAGHPTLGAIISLAMRQKHKSGALVIVEEKIGLIRGVADLDGICSFAEFDLPKLPERLSLDVEKETFAAALGLDCSEIGFANHIPTSWTAGIDCYFIPLQSLKTIASALPDTIYIKQNFRKINGKIPYFYLYSRETQLFQSAYHSRMFTADGIEDAATGAAASAFIGVVQHFDKPLDGTKQMWIEQGMEMGRPSRIRIEWQTQKGQLISARLGGYGIKIAEGQLFGT